MIIKHILKLITQGLPLRLAAVANIPNSLRVERNIGQVSVNQPSAFIKSRPKLKVRFNPKYNYKRALYKDPNII